MLLKLGSNPAACARPQRCQPVTPSVARPPALRQQQQQPRRLLIARAKEADVEQQQQQQEAKQEEQQQNGAEASQGEAGPSGQEGEQQAGEEQQQTPLERARAALSAAPIDQELLEASLAELEEEMSRAREGVTSAESRVTMLEGTLQTAKDQLLRLNADFDNFRRRSANEKDAIAGNVKGDVVAELLPLVDNFELARTQVKVESEGENKINSSYQALYKQLVDIMRGFGIEAVPTVGAEFDPEIHEAMMREYSDEHADGVICGEFRKGFRMGEKLVRPAMVKVSMGSESGSQGPSEPSGEGKQEQQPQPQEEGA